LYQFIGHLVKLMPWPFSGNGGSSLRGQLILAPKGSVSRGNRSGISPISSPIIIANASAQQSVSEHLYGEVLESGLEMMDNCARKVSKTGRESRGMAVTRTR